MGLTEVEIQSSERGGGEELFLNIASLTTGAECQSAVVISLFSELRSSSDSH